MDTYAVYTWDHDESDWQVEFTGLTKWQLRTALRDLYACGWTQISMRVEAETHDRPAARWNREFMASTQSPKSVRRRLMERLEANR